MWGFQARRKSWSLGEYMSNKGKSNVAIIVGVSVGGFVGIGIVIAIVVVLCCCRKVEDANNTPPFPAIGNYTIHSKS